MQTLLHFLAWNVGLSHATTQTTEAERQMLCKYVEGKRTVVEIGVWHGVTTSLLRTHMAPEGELFAVDPYQRGRLGISFPKIIAHRTVSARARGSVTWIRAKGVDAVNAYKRASASAVDFIFIDGDHSYEGLRDDWVNWKELVAPGGVIGLHDSRSTPQNDISDAGSVRFTEEVILRNPCFKMEDLVDTLTILRRVR